MRVEASNVESVSEERPLDVLPKSLIFFVRVRPRQIEMEQRSMYLGRSKNGQLTTQRHDLLLDFGKGSVRVILGSGGRAPILSFARGPASPRPPGRAPQLQNQIQFLLSLLT